MYGVPGTPLLPPAESPAAHANRDCTRTVLPQPARRDIKSAGAVCPYITARRRQIRHSLRRFARPAVSLVPFAAFAGRHGGCIIRIRFSFGSDRSGWVWCGYSACISSVGQAMALPSLYHRNNEIYGCADPISSIETHGGDGPSGVLHCADGRRGSDQRRGVEKGDRHLLC
jgi:hypothetical protein